MAAGFRSLTVHGRTPATFAPAARHGQMHRPRIRCPGEDPAEAALTVQEVVVAQELRVTIASVGCAGAVSVGLRAAAWWRAACLGQSQALARFVCREGYRSKLPSVMLLKLMQAPGWDWNAGSRDQGDAADPPTIIGVGDRARIVVMASGAIRTEPANFGVAGLPGPRPVCSWPVDAATRPQLAALWETQRCLVPISGLVEEQDGLRQSWLCRARAPAFAAGIRSARPARDGTHVSEFSLLTAPHPGDGAGDARSLPLLVPQQAVVGWFFLDGARALQALRTSGHPGFVRASPGNTCQGAKLFH
jgi:hypothetical protein